MIEDSCVGCHLEKTPPPASLAYNLGGTNHSFVAKTSICNQCHTNVEGDNLAAGFEDMIGALKVAIEDRIEKVMQQQIDAGNTIKAGSTTFSSFSQVEIIDGRNQQIAVTLTNGKRLAATNLTDVLVVKPDGTTETLIKYTGTDVPKAFWNWALLTYDASKGAHNPSWTLEVIGESMARMGASYKGANAITAGDLVVGMR